jgi:hypothetical protein
MSTPRDMLSKDMAELGLEDEDPEAGTLLPSSSVHSKGTRPNRASVEMAVTLARSILCMLLLASGFLVGRQHPSSSDRRCTAHTSGFCK